MRKTEQEEGGAGWGGRVLTRLTAAAGTVVGKVNATDRDQINTLHVKIRYTLLDGLDRFSIHPSTGVITTTTGDLDREVSFSDIKSNPSLFLASTLFVFRPKINTRSR